MNLVTATMILFSVLFPTKTWYSPNQSVDVVVKAESPVHLVLRRFDGREVAPAGNSSVTGEKTVDVKALFPEIAQAGSYVLFALPNDKPATDFVGTPLVILSQASPRFGGPVSTNVIHVEPLVYATMETSKGPIKALFWYDVAPNTVANFIRLSQGGYYNGLTFHRIVPGFVIQGGDPTGTGFGGPGYMIDAEFSDRQHDEGVLSMARTGDPLEGKGVAPRSDFANSAGSQFFICLSREKTQALDRKYSAFGKVFEGLDAVKAIAAVELAETSSGKPKEAPLIKSVTIVPVTAKDNPYSDTLKLTTELGLTSPTTEPATPTTK